VRAVTDLLHHYQHAIEELTVIGGTAGVFDFEVDGELLFSKRELGRHAHDGEVLELFRAHIDPRISEYPRD
jgi:selenoprotein W-related protein